MADRAASTLARLQYKAKETGRSYQFCLQLFCQEEFLRKVALSKYSNNLVLKGGLYIYTLTGFESRVTVDIDFLLRQMSNTESKVLQMVKEILEVETGNDFITFEVKGISPIALQKKYNGVSIPVVGLIKNTRTPFKIDFGVGDVIVPKPEKRKIPIQLDGFVRPEINTYSLESTIAEKFDAIITRYEFTSRMKDFYDIYYLSQTFHFDGRKMQEALFETLQNRGTSYDQDCFKSIMDLSSIETMNLRWIAFSKKINIPKLGFEVVLIGIKRFLEPVFESILEEREFFGQWNPEKKEWE